jgi:hypothetical protein
MVSESLGMVRDKVEAQQSAGVDAAKKRRIDRSTVDVALDETDKEAARTLLGRKKKRKTVAFYRKGWFTLLSVGMVLAALAFVVYLVFIKIPSADSYITTAQAQLKSADFKERKEGRALLEEFFIYYPSHAQTAAMRQLADRYDRDEREQQMHNRRARFKAEGQGESLAREALDNEDLGKLNDAALVWKQLAKFEDRQGDDHAWGLVAKKYLDEIKAVEKKYRELRRKAEEQKKTPEKSAPEDKYLRLALDAVRKEAQGQALTPWNDLKTLTKDDADQRHWYLLAAHRYREVSEKQLNDNQKQ